MKKLMLAVLCVNSLFLSGCATYFLRKECEKKNWYQYGYDLAMQGKRPSQDEYLLQCRKAEAEISESQLDVGFKAGMSNYCKPDVAWQTGKNGDDLNTDLCDQGMAKILRGKHAEGLKQFCQPDNGYNFGTSGKVYRKNCPQDLEKAFVKEYSRGRKKYLQAMVVEAQGKIADYDHKIQDRDRDIRNTTLQIATLPPPQQVVQRTVINGQIHESTQTQDPNESRRRQLRYDLDRANTDINQLRSQQNEAKNRMYEYQRELSTLD